MQNPDDARLIRVRGAREHNLRAVDVELPRDRLIVVTGVSGSGKSSLAFDTIFAEGQRKYMESLSAYARQFLDQLRKPDVEQIEGLPPTIAIQQRGGGHSPRSTVATTTEIYDYLRLLYARCGTPTCWHGHETGTPCGRPITATPATQIVDRLLEEPEGTKLLLCAPVIRGRKGHHREALESLRSAGFVRARVNGEIVDLRDALKEGGENPLGLGRYERHVVEAVVDRLVLAPDGRGRLADSVETALRTADGLLVAVLQAPGEDSWTDRVYSAKHACPVHPECALEELEPRLFSFNSPYGACAACDGLGTVSTFDEALVVPDADATLAAGAIAAWRKQGPRMTNRYARLLRKACTALGIDRSVPWRSLTRRHRRILLHGTTAADETRDGFAFEGVIPDLRRRWENTDSDFVKERLRTYMSDAPCGSCGGRRLRPEALAVRLRSGSLDLNVSEVTALTIGQAAGFVETLELTEERASIAGPILREVAARLGFLASVGLGYLNLDRTGRSLSGGEAQRIRLATQVGSGLVGVCYVLDEPTIGLHPRDNDRLVGTLRRLADVGNTVLVVEHDEAMIRAADHVVDVGPGAGKHGGTIVAQGDVDAIERAEGSLTGDFLSGRRGIPVPDARRPLDAARAIVVKGARQNNLRSVDVAFPLGGIVCVTGVSGSGKSTLVNEILVKAVRRSVLGSRDEPGAHDRVTGLKGIERVVVVDQSPIGRTPRSNPATYTGIFDEIRRVFARTKEARVRGYEPGRFSFNVRGGRCEACQGQGVKKIEMHFLPDVFVECEACRGARYNRETLEILYRHKSIADVLRLTIEEALEFFDAHDKVRRMIACLHDVGLDYVELGQPSPTLSGGEAQRVKLASELGNRTAGPTLYVLDEPTTGLHFADVERLLHVLHRLADAGHTLVVIEHNLDVVKTADWIVDLGPEGGDRGGTLVAEGTPETVAGIRASHTGRALKPLLRPRRTPKRRRAVAGA